MAAGPILYQNPQATTQLPGGDPFVANAGQAAQDVETQRNRTLQGYQLAADAGKQAVIQGTANINSTRDAAMQAEMREAQQRGAPPEAIAEIQNRIAAPYNNYSASMQAGDVARQQDLNYRGAGYNQYFSELAPAVQAGHDRALGAYQRERAAQDAQRAYEQAQLENQVAMAKYQAQQDQIQRDWQQAQAEREFNYKVAFDKQQFDEDVRRWGLEFAQKQQAARDAAARSGRGSQGSNGYFGTGYTQGELKALVPDAITQLRGAVDPHNLTGSVLGKIVGIDKTTRAAAAGSVANQLGIPGGAITALLPKYKSGLGQTNQGIMAPLKTGGFGPNPNLVPKYTQPDVYNQAVEAIKQMQGEGMDVYSIIQQLHSVDVSPATQKAIADYFPGFS